MAEGYSPRPTVDDIARWVKQGHSQSPSNCRVLLGEIERLRAALKARTIPHDR